MKYSAALGWQVKRGGAGLGRVDVGGKKREKKEMDAGMEYGRDRVEKKKR